MNSFHFGFKDQRLREFVHLRISEEMLHNIKQEADRKGSDLSQTIRDLLEEKLEKKGDSIGRNSKVQEDCVCSGL